MTPVFPLFSKRFFSKAIGAGLLLFSQRRIADPFNICRRQGEICRSCRKSRPLTETGRGKGPFARFPERRRAEGDKQQLVPSSWGSLRNRTVWQPPHSMNVIQWPILARISCRHGKGEGGRRFKRYTVPFLTEPLDRM